MYTEEKQAADFVLEADESVLWAERRTPRWNVEKITVSCAIVIAGLLLVLFVRASGVFYGLIVLGGSLWLMHSMLRRESRTLYLLTDKRALIVEAPFGGIRPVAVSVTLQPQLIAAYKRWANDHVDYLFVKYTKGSAAPRMDLSIFARRLSWKNTSPAQGSVCRLPTNHAT